MLTDYQKQAEDFMQKFGVTMEVKYLKTGKYFDDDKEERDIYEITISKNGRKYTFNFGQSISNSGFYYTKGRQKIAIDRRFLTKGKNELARYIRNKIDWGFINNGKSDLIHYPIAPTAYDVLAAVQKYDIGTFEDFCSEFGYDTDSKKAEKTYNAVKEEYLNIARLFTEDELTEMQEIN